MTEQEAKAFAQRLTRVWNPEKFGFYTNSLQGNDPIELDDLSSDFEYVGHLKVGLKLEVALGAAWHSTYEYFELSRQGLSLICEGAHVYPWMPAGSQEREEAFAREWMDFFRPRCWLSGAPIEATAHEKAQWTQGFSREEIEAWNLRF